MDKLRAVDVSTSVPCRLRLAVRSPYSRQHTLATLVSVRSSRSWALVGQPRRGNRYRELNLLCSPTRWYPVLLRYLALTPLSRPPFTSAVDAPLHLYRSTGCRLPGGLGVVTLRRRRAGPSYNVLSGPPLAQPTRLSWRSISCELDRRIVDKASHCCCRDARGHRVRRSNSCCDDRSPHKRDRQHLHLSCVLRPSHNNRN